MGQNLLFVVAQVMLLLMLSRQVDFTVPDTLWMLRVAYCACVLALLSWGDRQ